jgi:hypothetical protein
MTIRRQHVVDVVLWVFALFLAWVFFRQGVAKFSDTSGWARAFRVWHFPVWFRVVIGVAETNAALLLLTRRTAFAGALVIIAVMIGGMGTHALGFPQRPRGRSRPVPALVHGGVRAAVRRTAWGEGGPFLVRSHLRRHALGAADARRIREALPVVINTS